MSLEYVLVIDDSEIDAFITSRILEQCRFANDIRCVASAQEGLDLLKEASDRNEELPSHLFLDIDMPGINGFQFLEAFRELPQFIIAATRIIVLSSSIHPSDIRQANDNPLVECYLNKPLQEEDVRRLTRLRSKSA
jgi:CheY-like chemotaxis protein